MNAVIFCFNLIVLSGLALFGTVLFVDRRKWKKIAANLRQDNRQMHRIIDFLPDPTMVIDHEKRLIVWNRAMEAMTGVKAGDMLGKGDYEYAIPFYGKRRQVMIDLVSDWDEHVAQKYINMERRDDILVSETMEAHPLLKRGIFRIVAGPLRDDNGNLIGAIERIHDITGQRKKLEDLKAREELLRVFVAYSPAAVAMCDLKMNYLHYSRRWITDFQLPDENLTGSNHYDVFDWLPEHWKAQDYRCMQGETITNEEEAITRPDGSVEWVRRILHPWRTHKGTIGGIIILAEVTTEQKQAQEEIRKRQAFLESVLSHAPDAIVTLDPHHRVLDWNPGAEKIFGYRRDEALGKKLDDLVGHRKSRQEVEKNIKTALSGQRVEAFEGVRYRKDGKPVHVIVAGSPIMLDDTQTGALAVYTDITALKQAEEELRRNERMLRRIMDIVPSMIFAKNAEGRFLMVNQAVADRYRMPVEELVGRLQADIHPDKDQVARYLADDRRAMVSGSALFVREEPFQDHAGATRWLEVIKVPCDIEDFGEPAVVALATDITARREAEARIQDSEKRYRAMFENTGTGTVLSEADTTLSMVNREFARMVGYDRSEIEGKMSWTRLIAPKDVERLKAYHFNRRKDSLNTPSQYECSLIDRQGNVIPTLLKVRLIPGTRTSIGSFLDISEQKKAVEEMRQLRNYLSNIIDSMPSVLIGVDTDGRVTQWNKQAERVTGLPFEKACAQPLADVFPYLLDEMDRIRLAIRDRKVIHDPKIPRRQLNEIHFEDVTIYPLIANGVDGAVIRVDDVTERVRLEEMMIQSEKMLSVGGLAAGMAHEINNPLAGILQNTAVLENRLIGDLPANRKAAETTGISMAAVRQYIELRKLPTMLENIRDSGNRAATIVKNMLSFARKSDRVVSSHDLAVLLDRTLDLARTDYDMKKQYDFKQIKIVREYDPKASAVPCEASKLQQVFLNILKNGAEAMASRPNRQHPPTFVLRVCQEDRWIRLEIEDNGPGMDETTRRRIFEPFFTTKPVGKGTGLGLSVSYFIVTENHGGKMDAHAVDGGGTRFVIRLPKTGKA